MLKMAWVLEARLADDTQHKDPVVCVVDSISAVDRQQWNALTQAHPFMDWDFLEAVEATRCLCPETGWGPRHVLVKDGHGQLIGAAPLYMKAHSRGEFVFDHSWANALEQAGGNYYPKLLCAAPFTPVTGPRLLTLSGPDEAVIRTLLARALVQLTEQWGLSSAHVNFLEPDVWEELGREGWLLRNDQQYHWFNRDYQDFDGFLAAMSSRKRKMVRKERAAAQEGLNIRQLTGDQIQPEHWDAFYEFYTDTGERKWGSPYLNREFFEQFHEKMRDKILLIMAFEDDQPIAGALNVIGPDALYGRYWGRSVERPFLHFEVCYYQAIDFAIEHGLARVEAGAQGQHKLARGYEPVETRSAHWITHPGLRDAVDAYLKRERTAVEEDILFLEGHTPFRKDGTPVGQHQPVDEEGF